MVPEIENVQDINKIIEYVMREKKSALKAPQIISQQGVLTASTNSIIHSFLSQQQLNPSLKQPFKHFILSFDKSDVNKINDHTIDQYLTEYMDELKLQSKGKIDLEPSQYLLVRHYDSEHIHYHLILNRVLGYRKTIKEGNLLISNKYSYRALAKRWGLKLIDVLEQKKEQQNQQYHTTGTSRKQSDRSDVIYNEIIPTFLQSYNYVIQQPYPPNHDLIGELINRLSNNLTILESYVDHYLRLEIKTNMLMHTLSFHTGYVDPSLSMKKLIHLLETKQPIRHTQLDQQIIGCIENATNEASFIQNMKRLGLIVSNMKPTKFMVHSKGKKSRTFRKFGKATLQIYFDLKKEHLSLSFDDTVNSINYLKQTIQQTLPTIDTFNSFISTLESKKIKTTVKKDQSDNIVGITFHYNNLAISGTRLNYKYSAKRLIKAIKEKKEPLKVKKNTPK